MINLSPEQFKCLAHCIESPEYFVENFCWLEQKASAGVAESSAIIPFQLGERPGDDFYFQRRILRWLHNRENVLTLKSRRVGCSWIAAAYCAWLLNFHKGVNVIFISRNGKEAKKILGKVKFILKNLAYHDSNDLRKATKADWLRGEIETDNQQEFSIGYRNDDGLVTILSTAESLTTTDDSARGDDATFIVFDELAFYEHPDETWSSALKTLARGGHWMAISTPNGVGDIFHRLCSRGDLDELGKLGESLGYKYIKIHWSEAGITREQMRKASVGSSTDLTEQEWEWKFLVAGSTAFNPTNLAACYKPPHEYPEIAEELERYKNLVETGNGKYMYYSGVDTIRGRAHKKSRDKDFNSWTSLTQSGIQAFHYYDQSEISEWAGQNVDSADGGRLEIEGTTTKLHRDWPGVVGIEENGPGLTTAVNHQIPSDTFSEKRYVDMHYMMKRGIVERFAIKVDAHGVVITDPFTYQCLLVFQRGANPGQFEAPAGYFDDPVISIMIAADEMDKDGQLHFEFGGNADAAKKINVQHPFQPDASVRLAGGPILDIEVRPDNARLSDLMAMPGINSDDLDDYGQVAKKLLASEEIY